MHTYKYAHRQDSTNRVRGVRFVKQRVTGTDAPSHNFPGPGHAAKGAIVLRSRSPDQPRARRLNDIENLWPQPYPDATAKDKVENALHALVCAHKLSLKAAQHGIANNWVTFRDSLIKARNWPGVTAENVR